MDGNCSSPPSRRKATPGGLGLRPPVLLSLLSNFNSSVGGATVGAASMRYLYSCLEKLGWSFPAGASLLLVNLESPAVLGALYLLRLGKGFTERSKIHVYIDFFDVPACAKLGSKKLDVASFEASSSSWRSASSCMLVVPFLHGESDERWLWLPAVRIAGKELQGLGCNLSCFRVVLVSCQCKLLY